VESIGARLKREREQRKITLDEIAVSTKIGTRFLAAIEDDRFDQLPGGIFNKGFIRAYARHLGMDENQAIADFVAATEPSLPEPPAQDAPVLAALAERVPEAKKKSRSDGGIPWGIFAIVLLVLACGFALWGFHSREHPARPSIEVPGPV
jgi:cytoskeleton protein RodZ